MAQVSTDKIDEKIAKLLTEAEGLREREKIAAFGGRDGGMAEHFAMRERVYAISVLEELLKEASDD